jgi:hypothetical protein
MHIKYSATSAKYFTFCMKPLGEREKEFHHGETFGHSFTCVGNCVKPPIETQIEFHHATMQLNHTMRERLWDH